MHRKAHPHSTPDSGASGLSFTQVEPWAGSVCGSAILMFSVLWVMAAVPAHAQATGGPFPPCDGAAPEYPELGMPPVIEIWYGDDLADWRPAACTGWEAIEFNVLIATAGRFRHDGDAAAILGRLGTVSDLNHVQYWSHTREIWRPLILDADALNSPDPDDIRADFSADELAPGRDFYIWQHENTPARALVYRVEVLEHTPRRAVLALQNTDPLKYLFLTVFEAGEYQFLYFFDREVQNIWRYYSLIRIGAGFNPLVRAGGSSYMNRAAAMYRHFAGIPTDQEPPAAP